MHISSIYPILGAALLAGFQVSLARKGTVTLVYSAHDEAHNDASVLRDVLLGR